MIYLHQVLGSGIVWSAETGQKIYVLIYWFNKAMFCPNYTQQQKQGRSYITLHRTNLTLLINLYKINTTIASSANFAPRLFFGKIYIGPGTTTLRSRTITKCLKTGCEWVDKALLDIMRTTWILPRKAIIDFFFYNCYWFLGHFSWLSEPEWIWIWLQGTHYLGQGLLIYIRGKFIIFLAK